MIAVPTRPVTMPVPDPAAMPTPTAPISCIALNRSTERTKEDRTMMGVGAHLFKFWPQPLRPAIPMRLYRALLFRGDFLRVFRNAARRR